MKNPIRDLFRLGVMGIIVSSHAAYAIYLPPMVSKATINDDQSEQYLVDDIEIEMNAVDKVRAKNWNLTNIEYAKYKYVMEYMPRGKWTPDLDPPIVLGNLARTDKERLHYAEIMNELEQDRRLREVEFQRQGNEYIKVMLAREGYTYTDERKDPRQTGNISSQLPKGKLELRSLYLDLDNCNVQCTQWVRSQITRTPRSVKMDIYIKGASETQPADLKARLNLPVNEVEEGRYNFTTDEELFDKRTAGMQLPFLIQNTDSNVKVFTMDMGEQ
ncbi:hypothetical protein [Vibrio crassostreae]|uniref:hypothetical protein n=1 Tax=Vibrio crassostreae TaxID=246167 RepID=UPI001B317D5C|nr:hypothetical protein [Vibrio crassostreae]